MFLRSLLLLALLASFALTAVIRPPEPSDDEDYEDSEESSETEVYEGGYAPLGMYPFVVAIHRLAKQPSKHAICSGSLIGRRWVLTAGHCVYGKPQMFLLGFGLVDKQGTRFELGTAGGLSMVSVVAHIHPNYDNMGRYDIGLIQAPRWIPYGVTIKPVRLAGAAYAGESFADWDGYVFGWGRKSRDATAAQRLSFGQVPVMDNSDCRYHWRITGDHMCTEANKLTDICQGGDGGPLVVREENDEFLQIGIMSFGDAYGCPSDLPDVYTRVSSYQSWIENMTGIAFD